MFTPEDREATVRELAEILGSDDRIESIVLVGSLAAGKADAWSDIDLVAVVAEGNDLAALADEWTKRVYRSLPVVHHYATEFPPSLLRGFLLENLLEIDLDLVPVDDLSLYEPARIVLDRDGRAAAALRSPSTWKAEPPDYSGEAGFVWHDVLHACAAVRRGRAWQALWYMQRVRNRALLLAQQRRGHYADFFDYVDDLAPEERPFEGSLISSLEPAELLRAIEVATTGFLVELRRGEPALAARLEPALLKLVTEAKSGR